MRREQRLQEVKRIFKRSNTSLYTLQPAFLEPCLRRDIASKQYYKECARELYSFPFFTKSFCDAFVEEIQSYREQLGHICKVIVPSEFGFEKMLADLKKDYITKMIPVLFPDLENKHVKDVHAKVVTYRKGEDVHWERHIDDSDITMTVCLGTQFEGSELVFYDNKPLSCDVPTFTMLPNTEKCGKCHKEVNKSWKCEECQKHTCEDCCVAHITHYRRHWNTIDGVLCPYNKCSLMFRDKLEESDGFCCYSHTKGHAVIHRGTHFHEVMPLKSGYRLALVVLLTMSD